MSEPRSALDKIRLAIRIACGIYLALLVAFNLEKAPIEFVFFKVEMPVLFLILISAALGAALVWGLRAHKALRREEQTGKR